jgi:ATP-dependent Clp protease protease subunit
MIYNMNIDPCIKEIELRTKPIIIRVNKFDEESAKTFASQMGQAHNTGQSKIPIIIDSYGGEVYSLMSMISSIQNATLPVATIVEGKAMSCGAILFSFGDEGLRFIDPNATIMIHDVSSMAWGKIEEVKSSSKEAERLNKIVYEMMAQNCGKRKDYFLKKVHKRGHADWFLDAKSAKKHNLANFTVVPKLNVDVTVNIDLVL